MPNDLALITLSEQGLKVCRLLAERLGPADLYVHREAAPPDAETFDRVVELSPRIFHRYRRLVYVMPSGVVVRAIAASVQHKLKDPAVVVTDVLGRWAVSLLSGHEGGANDLALAVGNALGAEPVITTTSEAAKDLIVGLGCRRGTSTEALEAALREGLGQCGGELSQVRYLASVDIKADEVGLMELSRRLEIPFRTILSEEIRKAPLDLQESGAARRRLDLPGVAEPAALLAGRRTRLILPRTIVGGVTVAVAREEEPV
ncbi:cobalamin biosynthesis protein [Holophaga foetida]|uniref:cobalamin biosynthesis protein n=1 Tax=Holophaga foetida TaxID=35839 RepID=UPI0002471CEE|nr:cobalamin biosynthesis protein [Holophaga foetida]